MRNNIYTNQILITGSFLLSLQRINTFSDTILYQIFYWRHNQYELYAYSSIFLHSTLLIHNRLYLIPIFRRASSSLKLTHLLICLPLYLLLTGRHSKFFLEILCCLTFIVLCYDNQAIFLLFKKPNYISFV